MLIMSQNKKTIFNVMQTTKYFINVHHNPESAKILAYLVDVAPCVTVGKYKNEDRAKEVLAELFEAFNRQCRTFQMPED